MTGTHAPRRMALVTLASTVAVAAGAGCGGDGAVPATRAEPPEGALQRAEEHLRDRGGDVDAEMTLVLAHLERRFGLDWAAPQREEALAAAGESGTLRYLRRLVDPAVRADPADLAAVTAGVDDVTLPVLFCHDLPDAVTLEDLAPMAAVTGYELTHGALALQWMVENECVSRDAARELRDTFLAALAAEVERSGPSDVGIEAMAMLYYLGAQDRVDAGWLQQVHRAQNPDGGWGEGPGEVSNDHTSTLALWVLLEASARARADVTWIPDPGPGSGRP